MSNSTTPATKTYLVRFGGGGYNTVNATSKREAEKKAKDKFNFAISSVALPKKGEIEALDEFWASQFR
jgi:hypothetical protein